MKKFPDIRSVAWRSTKEQKWNTVVKTAGSGKVRTLTTWRRPQYTIDIQFASLNPKEYRALHGFVSSIRGSHEPFLWLDHEDCEEKGIMLGKGNTRTFQAVRNMGGFLEPVAHIEKVTLYVNGTKTTKFTVSDGVITYNGPNLNPSDTITADYVYYWKVRLANDGITTEATFKNFFKSKSIKLVTVQ